jgi:site-specific DNA recombinase
MTGWLPRAQAQQSDGVFSGDANLHGVVRLVVRDILVGDETIVIRHSIPLSSMTPSGDGAVQSKFAAPPAPDGRSYLLRSGGGDGPSAKSLPLEPAAKALSNQSRQP